MTDPEEWDVMSWVILAGGIVAIMLMVCAYVFGGDGITSYQDALDQLNTDIATGKFTEHL